MPDKSTSPGFMEESLVRLSDSVEELRKAVVSKKKDRWDKTAIIAQFLSGVLIGSLGIVISIVINRAQRQISEKISNAQLEVSKRQQVSAYFKEIVNQSDPLQRAQLIGALDIAVSPENAVPIAMYYARNAREGSPGSERPLFDQPMGVLRRLRRTAQAQLEALHQSEQIPDRDIAGALIGKPIRVRVRTSQIDDIANFYINGSPILSAGVGEDSGWIDVTDKLHSGKNDTIFAVDNGPFGGFSGRVEISAGTQQYDSGLILRSTCPCNAPAFYITGALFVSDGIGLDGTVRIVENVPDYY